MSGGAAPRTARPLVVFVDVDDTLVRSYGTKRIPMTEVVDHVRKVSAQGAVLYCWSSGGAEYAKQSAVELGLEECFVGFLPKPHVMIDDQPAAEWKRFVHVGPWSCSSMDVAEYRRTTGVEP
ncbi:MAG: DUF705 domain-containing protein [Planctomycetota bacterium]